MEAVGRERRRLLLPCEQQLRVLLLQEIRNIPVLKKHFRCRLLTSLG